MFRLEILGTPCAPPWQLTQRFVRLRSIPSLMVPPPVQLLNTMLPILDYWTLAILIGLGALDMASSVSQKLLLPLLHLRIPTPKS